MGILYGAILSSTLGAKSIVGNYCILILRASSIWMVPMDLWMKKNIILSLGPFLQWNWYPMIMIRIIPSLANW